MKIHTWYRSNFEHRLSGRYIHIDSINPLLNYNNGKLEIIEKWYSEKGEPIPLIKIGNGKKIVLGWSQMHGNESTTTKAIFDFLRFIDQKEHFQPEIERFLNSFSFYVFPILNPDGARSYTRENANNVDLNRDAQELSQPESKCLSEAFKMLNPSLCLNLHDQRSIFGLSNGKAAQVSFLSPAANKERSITPARQVAMERIVAINSVLQTFIPGQVGRYDDSFNDACVGDSFQMAGVPTILFEAGHSGQDYAREKSREYVFYALLSVFNILSSNNKLGYNDYFKIPENQKNYRDIILRNVKIKGQKDQVSVAIQYKEALKDGKIIFEPFIDEMGNLKNYHGHFEKDIKGEEILTIPQNNLTVGAKISDLVDRMNNSLLIFVK